MSDLAESIKRAAVRAVGTQKPTNLIYGTVVQEDPLKIQIEQKLVIEAELGQIVLTRNVTDYELPVEISVTSGTTSGHTHNVSMAKIDVKNHLTEGERVAMIQQAGGQRFIVLDRVVIDE